MWIYYHLCIWLSEAVDGPSKGYDDDETDVIPSRVDVLAITVEKKLVSVFA